MAAPLMALDEASKLLSMITALDAKMHALIKDTETQMGELERTKEEIKKRINLEAKADALETKIRQLQTDAHDMKNQRDEKVTLLTNAGWVVPIPPSPIPIGRVTM